jgi:membrane-bound ClpP family serine protease
VRAGSLAIVGILLINIALFHTKYSMALLGVAGVVLVLRGLLSAAFSFTKK